MPGETEPYYDLGSYHRPIDTPSPQAQVWWDRGMVWSYAFNHDEAIRCFDRALELDPDLAIARWGVAYATGPNYNKAWEAFDQVDLAASLARARMELNLAATGRASAVEHGLIEALKARFPTDDPNDADALQAGSAAYADAMATLAEAYPDDIDVQTLAADALVNLTAWALWDTRTGEPAPGSRVVEAKGILDEALATSVGRAHPGVLHLYLHTMEMSASPQDALPAADLLRNLVPDAGHLQHMPSHIDVLCGNYRDSVVSNLSAVQVDRRFVEREGPLNFYSLYRAHNLHFVVYSAMFEGNSRTALDAAAELVGQLTPELLAIESPPMADWLEAFVPLRIHVLVRFGRWDDLISEPLPDDPDLYCSTAATIHYGRGVAHAAKGQLPQAHAERDAFAAAYARIPDTRYLFNNTVLDILAIAAEMLDGEIAYREEQIRGGVRSSQPCDRTRRRTSVRRTVGLDAADPARLRRTAARAGTRRGGRPGVRRRPRSGPDAGPAVSASWQCVEPARLPRMSTSVGTHRRGGDHRPAARPDASASRCADPGIVCVPARCGRHLSLMGHAGAS